MSSGFVKVCFFFHKYIFFFLNIFKNKFKNKFLLLAFFMKKKFNTFHLQKFIPTKNSKIAIHESFFQILRDFSWLRTFFHKSFFLSIWYTWLLVIHYLFLPYNFSIKHIYSIWVETSSLQKVIQKVKVAIFIIVSDR